MTRRANAPQSRHHVWLFDSDMEKIERILAPAAGMTKSQYIRQLVHKWIRHYESSERAALDSARSQPAGESL